jgi:hypothetical protein
MPLMAHHQAAIQILAEGIELERGLIKVGSILPQPLALAHSRRIADDTQEAVAQRIARP